MGLDTGNISQLDFMIRNSLKMKTYHILCKVFKTCSAVHVWGWAGQRKITNREKKRERRKEERKEGKSQKKKKGRKRQGDEMTQHQIHVLNHRDQENRRAATEGLLSQGVGSVCTNAYTYNTKTLLVQTK